MTQFLPKDVTNFDLAFGPRNVRSLYLDGPLPEEISRKDLERGERNFSALFFGGGRPVYKARKGIDGAKALRHIQALARSFEPKHEAKEKACAELFALWFEEFDLIKDPQDG